MGRAGRGIEALLKDLKGGAFDFVVNVLIASPLVPRHLRRALYRALGFNVGGASLSPHLTFKSNQIDIGDRVFINDGCWFDNLVRISIGDGVHIGPGVMFGTTSHEIGVPSMRAGVQYEAPVMVATGCWIGARAIVLPGVTVAEGCVVAAGAVVTIDCEPHGLYAGVPAKRMRDLPV